MYWLRKKNQRSKRKDKLKMKKETYEKLLSMYQNALAFGSDTDAYRKYEKKTVDQHSHLCTAIKLFMRLEGQEERFEKDTEELVEFPTKFYKVTFKMPNFERDHTDIFTDYEFAVQSAKEEIFSAKKQLKKQGEELPPATFKVSEYHP